VHPENVQPDQLHNFDIHVDDGDAIEAYDYDSVMHYSARNRAIDWRAGSVVEGQQSKAAPALTSTRGLLHMVHLGDTSNDIWWSIFDGTTWQKPDGTPGNERIPGQQSKATPALAVYNNQLHMVHLGDTSNDIWWSIFDGTTWQKPDGTPGNERIPGQQSKATPALAVYNNQLHMVHLVYTSNDIWWSIFDGTTWQKPDGTSGNERIPGQQSKTAPTLAEFGGDLHLIHLGASTDNIWTSAYSGIEWSTNRRRYDGQSRAPIAAAALGGQFYLVHIGEQSNRIWQTVFDTSLEAIVPPVGVTIGLEDHLSAGDVQAVAIAYP
jgi:hypothetical protein